MIHCIITMCSTSLCLHRTCEDPLTRKRQKHHLTNIILHLTNLRTILGKLFELWRVQKTSGALKPLVVITRDSVTSEEADPFCFGDRELLIVLRWHHTVVHSQKGSHGTFLWKLTAQKIHFHTSSNNTANILSSIGFSRRGSTRCPRFFVLFLSLKKTSGRRKHFVLKYL